MQETQIIVGVASLCSILAILATVVVVPSLYSEINEIATKVHDGVQAFRVDTDSAWTDLMDLQITVTPPSVSCPATANARVCNSRTARPAHRDRPGRRDSLANLDSPEDLDSPEYQDNKVRLALSTRPRANTVPRDPPDSPEAKDRKAAPEHLVSLDNLDATADKARLDLPDPREELANLVALEDLANPDSPEHQELSPPPCPDRRDPRAHPANLDNPERLDSPANPETLVSPEHRARPDIQDSPDLLANPEAPDPMDRPEATRLTVLALLATLCS
ncbi:hypothetical protein niasHS_011903 [Heterodera schachtii]|uniref:Nematode cuticle collagen N-terminal domain-containing protein n=1 Tax=Heterodera schachtii TaxID=97005 RepID=A0ABD2IPF4_HETSC